MIDYLKATFWSWCYLLSSAGVLPFMLPGVGLLYFNDFFVQDGGNTNLFMTIFASLKVLMCFGGIIGHWLFLGQLRFIEDPHSMCPAFFFVKAVSFFLKHKNVYIGMVQICNITLIFYIMFEIQVINSLYYEKWQSYFESKPVYFIIIVISCEITQIVVCIYILGFRFAQDKEYFYQYLWSPHAPVRPVQSLATSVEAVNSNDNKTIATVTEAAPVINEDILSIGLFGTQSESTVFDDIVENTLHDQGWCSCRCTIATIFKYIVHLISRLIGLFIMFLFSIVVWGLCIPLFIWLFVRIYILGVCFDNTKIVTKRKRVGWVFDFVVFHILFPLNVDKLVKVFLENEPTKYFITHFALIMFQIRYCLFVGWRSHCKSCIPDYNLKHDYITFNTLYDNGHTTYSRLLPRCDDAYLSKLPHIDDVVHLFERKQFIPETELNLSVLFAFYVRWFTHQFANTNELKHAQVQQPVGINLSQLYGATLECENTLRSFKDGLLKGITIDGKEFPCIIDDFHFGPKVHDDHDVVHDMPDIAKQLSSYVLLANVNDSIFLSPFDTNPAIHGPDFFVIQLLFWRHHQFIARQLKAEYPLFDDEKIFQISKLCNIMTCIKVTLALYADMGIVQTNLSADFDFNDLENLYNTWMYKLFGPSSNLFPCNSTNIWIEFNFMYRWHQLIPPTIKLIDIDEGDDDDVKSNDIELKTDEVTELTLPYENYVKLLTSKHGLERLLLSASKTRAGKLSLFNTEEFLCQTAVLGTIRKSRFYQLQSFNDYRERLGFDRYDSFEELTDDPETVNQLKNVYKHIDNVEFFVGLFAEQKIGKALHGPLVTAIFSSFVFSLLTSSKLLRKDWKTMFTSVGKEIVGKYTTLHDLFELHTDLSANDISLRIKE